MPKVFLLVSSILAYKSVLLLILGCAPRCSGRNSIGSGDSMPIGISSLRRAKRQNSWIKFIYLVLFVVLSSGCMTLFYYPTHETHVDTTRLPYAPEEIFFAAEDKTKLHAWYFKSS